MAATVLEPKQVFAPGLFKADPRQYGTSPKYESKGASADTMSGISSYLKITPYRLGQLLNLNNKHNAYQWFDGSRSPSSAYWCRITRLLLLVSTGEINHLSMVDHIDWKSGLVHYKNGNSSSLRAKRPVNPDFESPTAGFNGPVGFNE